MATPSEKLAASLEVLKDLQKSGNSIIRGSQLTQTHRERLLANGFIRSVIKGWYIPTRPEETQGDSTAWYASFWEFCGFYLHERFQDNWWLSPEQSIAIHSGNWSVPRQLLVRSPKAGNNQTPLLFGTSVFDHRSNLPADATLETMEGMRMLSLPSALIHCSPSMFTQYPTDMHTALAMVRDTSQILEQLLNGGHSVIAGRLTGALRNMGHTRAADDIINTMRTAGYNVREQDPFEKPASIALNLREPSPYVNRINMMWHDMRTVVPDYFPEAPGLQKNAEAYLKRVDDLFVSDAYHSLSIEGYRVSERLIERIRSGDWNPKEDEEDLQHKNAMAARGYWQAFQSVKKTIQKVLSGENPGKRVDLDHGEWYRELFAPGVTAGLLKPSDLAGYRNGPVYIKKSQHMPMNSDALRDAMPTFFHWLEEESTAAVRAVLGHFIFVYMHPYMDGNGRMARFLMNVMLASGGFPWTIIRVEDRDRYMQALEQASVGQEIRSFARFLGNLVRRQMDKE